MWLETTSSPLLISTVSTNNFVYVAVKVSFEVKGADKKMKTFFLLL